LSGGDGFIALKNGAYMGIIHTCDPQKSVTFIVWDGTVTPADWRRHIQELAADPGWTRSQCFLADLQTTTDTSSIGSGQVDIAATALGMEDGLLTGKRSAVVASLEFWRAQRFAEVVTGFGVTSVVFNSVDTACIFLGLDVTDTRQTLERLRVALRAQDGGQERRLRP
jgi:hypothetical protein